MPSDKTVLVQLSSLALGGTQLNAVDFAMAVEDYGYRSVLFGPLDTLPPEGPSLLDVASTRGVKIEAYQRAPGVLIKGAGELEQRAKAIGADIIHVYGADAEPRTAFWGPCRVGRRPFIHTIYEMSVEPEDLPTHFVGHRYRLPTRRVGESTWTDDADQPASRRCVGRPGPRRRGAVQSRA